MDVSLQGSIQSIDYFHESKSKVTAGNSEKPMATTQAEGLFTLHEDHAMSWAHVTGRLKSHLTLKSWPWS